jgi:hypothetical protein
MRQRSSRTGAAAGTLRSRVRTGPTASGPRHRPDRAPRSQWSALGGPPARKDQEPNLSILGRIPTVWRFRGGRRLHRGSDATVGDICNSKIINGLQHVATLFIVPDRVCEIRHLG